MIITGIIALFIYSLIWFECYKKLANVQTGQLNSFISTAISLSAIATIVLYSII